MSIVLSLYEITYNKIKNVNEKNIAVEVVFKFMNQRSITKILVDGVEDTEWILEENIAKKTFYENKTFEITAVSTSGEYGPVEVDVKLDDGIDLIFSNKGEPNAIPISPSNLNLLVKNINLMIEKSNEIKNASIKIKRWEGVQ